MKSYFGRNEDFINSFWNLLTFSKGVATNGIRPLDRQKVCQNILLDIFLEILQQ